MIDEKGKRYENAIALIEGQSPGLASDAGRESG